MTEEAKLTCTKLVKISDGRDQNGKPLWYHRRCGATGSEVKVGGLLGVAKAVLCAKHRALADREAFVSENGYPLGKISKKAKEDGYRQPRLPGTGVCP